MLVAHSLGTLLLAHWAADRAHARILEGVAGAFLVSVPDASGAQLPEEARSFEGVPRQALPFPALVIGSSTDPFASLAYQQRIADDWQAGRVNVGDHGHLNSSAGLGEWSEGKCLFAAFASGLGHCAGASWR